MSGRHVFRKQQLEKEDSELQEASPRSSLCIYKLRLFFQSNRDILFYKTYRRNPFEYCSEKEDVN